MPFRARGETPSSDRETPLIPGNLGSPLAAGTQRTEIVFEMARGWGSMAPGCFEM